MKNSKHILWFIGGMMIGTATGIAAAGRVESSKTLHRLSTETTKLDQMLRARTQKVKKTFTLGAGDFTKMIKKNLTNPIPDLYKATENFNIRQPETDYDW